MLGFPYEGTFVVVTAEVLVVEVPPARRDPADQLTAVLPDDCPVGTPLALPVLPVGGEPLQDVALAARATRVPATDLLVLVRREERGGVRGFPGPESARVMEDMVPDPPRGAGTSWGAPALPVEGRRFGWIGVSSVPINGPPTTWHAVAGGGA